jgi:allantoicase
MHSGKVLLLLTWLSIAVAQSENWIQQLPPDRYYDPDVDVTSYDTTAQSASVPISHVRRQLSPAGVGSRLLAVPAQAGSLRCT